MIWTITFWYSYNKEKNDSHNTLIPQDEEHY